LAVLLSELTIELTIELLIELLIDLRDSWYRFNSYTQQICIDDAVVIDPARADNPITNDGFTMQDLRTVMAAADRPEIETPESGSTERAQQPEAVKKLRIRLQPNS
jgi:hypothetical protein